MPALAEKYKADNKLIVGGRYVGDVLNISGLPGFDAHAAMQREKAQMAEEKHEAMLTKAMVDGLRDEHAKVPAGIFDGAVAGSNEPAYSLTTAYGLSVSVSWAEAQRLGSDEAVHAELRKRLEHAMHDAADHQADMAAYFGIGQPIHTAGRDLTGTDRQIMGAADTAMVKRDEAAIARNPRTWNRWVATTAEADKAATVKVMQKATDDETTAARIMRAADKQGM